MSTTIATASDYLARIAKVRSAMVAKQVDATLLSVGHDLPYLSGYFAMPLERLTMLVIPQNGEVVMVVPRLVGLLHTSAAAANREVQISVVAGIITKTNISKTSVYNI